MKVKKIPIGTKKRKLPAPGRILSHVGILWVAMLFTGCSERSGGIFWLRIALSEQFFAIKETLHPLSWSTGILRHLCGNYARFFFFFKLTRYDRSQHWQQQPDSPVLQCGLGMYFWNVRQLFCELSIHLNKLCGFKLP